MKYPTLLLLILTVVIFACSKKNDIPSPPQPQTSLSLSYKPTIYGNTSFELMVSDNQGKTLLDTVATNNTMLTLTVSSQQQTFNITTIEYDSSAHSYNVTTFLNVLPKNWYLDTHMFLANFPFPLTKNNGAITYLNVPSQTGMNSPIMFSSLGASFNKAPSTNILTIQYDNAYNNEAYLMLPNYGLYTLTPIKTGNDTVDFAHADTVVKLNYSKPFTVSYSNAFLAGYRTRNNGQSCMALQFTSFGTGYDIMYPPAGFEQFALGYYAKDNQNREYNYFSFSDQVPGHLNFIDASYVNAGVTSQNNISVQFLKDQPSFYLVQYASSSVNWGVYTSPAQTTITQPLSIAAINQGKLLRGVNVGDVKPQKLTMTKADDYDYAGALQQVMDTASRTQVKLCRSYTQPL